MSNSSGLFSVQRRVSAERLVSDVTGKSLLLRLQNDYPEFDLIWESCPRVHGNRPPAWVKLAISLEDGTTPEDLAYKSFVSLSNFTDQSPEWTKMTPDLPTLQSLFIPPSSGLARQSEQVERSKRQLKMIVNAPAENKSIWRHKSNGRYRLILLGNSGDGTLLLESGPVTLESMDWAWSPSTELGWRGWSEKHGVQADVVTRDQQLLSSDTIKVELLPLPYS